MKETAEIIKGLREEVQRSREDISLVMEVNVKLRKELRMLEKLIELNMKDLWNIADQRDWYYEEYRKLKFSPRDKELPKNEQPLQDYP